MPHAQRPPDPDCAAWQRWFLGLMEQVKTGQLAFRCRESDIDGHRVLAVGAWDDGYEVYTVVLDDELAARLRYRQPAGGPGRRAEGGGGE